MIEEGDGASPHQNAVGCRGLLIHGFLWLINEKEDQQGQLGARSVRRRPALDFGSSHDVRVVRSASGSTLSGQSARDSLSLPLSPYPLSL